MAAWQKIRASRCRWSLLSLLTVYRQGYNSSDTCQLLGMLALREQRALGAAHRFSSQLAKLGKLRVERKHRSSVPDPFKGIVPDDHSFTCESVFHSLLKGDFPLLYSFKGKHMANVGSNTDADAI